VVCQAKNHTFFENPLHGIDRDFSTIGLYDVENFLYRLTYGFIGCPTSQRFSYYIKAGHLTMDICADHTIADGRQGRG
jgi:hypothetical protein